MSDRQKAKEIMNRGDYGAAFGEGTKDAKHKSPMNPTFVEYAVSSDPVKRTVGEHYLEGHKRYSEKYMGGRTRKLRRKSKKTKKHSRRR